MFLSLHMIFSLERAAVVWAILERISDFDSSLEMIAPRYLKFSTSSSLWPFILISLWKPFGCLSKWGITTYRNGPERTGTNRNGPERTETDLRNGLLWVPKRTGTDFSGYRNGQNQNQNQNCYWWHVQMTIIHQDLWWGKLVPSPYKRSELSNRVFCSWVFGPEQTSAQTETNFSGNQKM